MSPETSADVVDARLTPATIGVSLKMYLGHHATMRWCARVAQVAGDHPAVTGGLAELFVLPSFPSIPGALDVFEGTGVHVGGQDLHDADDGPFTGEVSGRTLRELGCSHAEVGHAERRRLFGEDDELVGRKTAAALRHRLVPVLCVGEPDRVPPAAAAERCTDEVDRLLAHARADGVLGPVTVAYEPHWAIGADEPAPVPHIVAVCSALADAVGADEALTGSRVVYGGSAGPGLLTRLGAAVDGLFLGRFAHDPEALSAVLDEVVTLRAPAGPTA